MTERISDIRARTNAEIKRLDAEREREIQRLKTEYANDLAAVIRKSEEEQAEIRRRIAEMERKREEQYRQGKRQIAQEMEQLKKRLQEQLDAKVRELKAEIARREKKLQECIRERFDAFDRRLNELFQRQRNQENREKEYALSCLRQAEKDFRQIMASETVLEFNGGELDAHQRIYNALQPLVTQRLWPAVASQSVTVSVECARIEHEAEYRLDTWNYWNKKVLERVQELLKRLKKARVAAWEFCRGEYKHICAPFFWNEENLSLLESDLTEMETVLLKRRPRCRLENMQEKYMDIFPLEEKLKEEMNVAESRVSTFLLMAQLLGAIDSEMLWLAPEWELHQEGQLQEIQNCGSMIYRLSPPDIGELTFTVHAAKGGGVVMNISYDGAGAWAARSKELQDMCDKLKIALSSDAYGGLQMQGVNVYADGNLACVSVLVSELPLLQGRWNSETAETIAAESGEESDMSSRAERNRATGV